MKKVAGDRWQGKTLPLEAVALQRKLLGVQEDPAIDLKYCSFRFQVPEYTVMLIHNYTASQVVPSHPSQRVIQHTATSNCKECCLWLSFFCILF